MISLPLPKTYYLAQAYALAMKSPDQSTQVGAVLVNHKGKIVGEGCNSLLEGIQMTPEKISRPLKYHYIEHAERNAILDARKNGYDDLSKCVMFCPYFSCSDCTRAIIRSKVNHIVGHKILLDGMPERWRESVMTSYAMLQEVGITYEHLDVSLKTLYPEMNLKIRFDDKDLEP
jgi:dCMP deaminase